MNLEKQVLAQKLMDTFQRYRRYHRQQSPVHGIKHSELKVLFRIKEHSAGCQDGVRVSQISHYLKVTSPTVTQLIKQLEISGLVTRTMDAEDRRSIRVRLTEKGELWIQEAKEAFFAGFIGLVDHLGTEKSCQFDDLFNEAIDYFSKSAVSV